MVRYRYIYENFRNFYSFKNWEFLKLDCELLEFLLIF